MSNKNTRRTGLGDIFSRDRRRAENPLLDKVQSGIYKAITTGDADPEGRGRLAAYIPKLAGDPERPLYFQYASPFGGSDGVSNYGMFFVPPDPGLTIMVFFANNGDLKEGYWFAVAGGVPDVVSGGPAGKARADGTGQGEGVFSDVPAAKSRIPDIQSAQQAPSYPDPTPSTSALAEVQNRPLSTDLLEFVKTQEGFDKSSKWDYSQYSSGYGSKPKFDGEYISEEEAEKRLKDTLSETRNYVIRFGLEKGYNWSEDQVNALTSYANSVGNINDLTKGGTISNAKIAERIADSARSGGTKQTAATIQRRLKESEWFLSGDQGDTSEPLYSNHPRNINVAAQGLYSDTVRGQSGASPMRDARKETPEPSRVYGIKTPGQNALTIDDGSVGEDGTIYPSQIRLTTGSGASVILDGDNDFIYMINSSGSAWVEIGADGNVMSYAQGSISMRAENDINLRADRDVNIDAGRNINARSVNDTFLNNKNYHNLSTGSHFTEAKGHLHQKIGQNMYASTGGVIHLNGPLASNAMKINTKDQPDIQNLESTQAKDIAVPIMPSHEPFIRPVSPAYSGGSVIKDPDSYEAKQEAMNQPKSAATVDALGLASDIPDITSDVTAPTDSAWVSYANNISVRNLPIVPRLFNILESAAKDNKIKVLITSGGQHSSGSRRRGSARHNDGYAADVQLFKNGQRLYLTNSTHLPLIQKFFKSAKTYGATSIGAGPGYMGGYTYHIDIAQGNTIPTNAAKTWGAGNKYASAPSWLKSLMG